MLKTTDSIRIQVGIGSKEEFFYFLKEGADEFYAGISTIPGHLYGGKNLKNELELLDIAKIAQNHGKKFFVVANEVRGDIFKDTIKSLIFLLENGCNGVIIRDPALLLELKKRRINTYIILSSLVLCFNTLSLDFYRSLGINRIALPEQITKEEAFYIIKNKRNIDVEMFITAREYCVVLNGFCYLKQFNNNCICRKGFKAQEKIFAIPRFSLKEHYANLYHFYKMGVKIIKIGRSPDNIYAKIIFSQAKLIKEILKKAKNEEDFINEAFKIHMKFDRILKCKK